MDGRTVDVDALIGGWRAAFTSAESALHAAGRQLPRAELHERTRRLAEERTATARLLDGIARDEHAKHSLVRLVAAPSAARRLLGVPTDAAACVFSLDGVLIGSAAIHAQAWRETFDAFLAHRLDPAGRPLAGFDTRTDYRRHIHGRPRLEGVREFLASRGISLPDGDPRDAPGTATVHGLANAKKRALVRRLDDRGVTAFEGARLYLELAHDAGLRSAVVSASANARTMLEHAHLDALVDDRVDGETMAAERLRRKPASDTLLAACRHLHVEPRRTVVFETTAAGVEAGRAGGFELVVGVGRGDAAGALRSRGADVVVSDLGELLERRLAA